MHFDWPTYLAVYQHIPLTQNMSAVVQAHSISGFEVKGRAIDTRGGLLARYTTSIFL